MDSSAHSSWGVDEWRQFFQKSETDICTLITYAICVAASESPHDLEARKDEIAKRLAAFSTQMETPKENNSASLFQKNPENTHKKEGDNTALSQEKLENARKEEDESTALFQRKLENTRKRLRESYETAEKAKRSRVVKMLSLRDLPQQKPTSNIRKRRV